MADDNESPIAHTKHGDITLDEVAEQLPGMARLMVEVSDRYWICYYAAKGGNWLLARFQLNQTRKTLSMATVVRPKYKEMMEAFEADFLKPIGDAIKGKDWDAFEAAFKRATDDANARHAELGYSFIDWQLPDTPPAHLRLDGGE